VKITCIIPARSGSKRIKNKNIIKFKKTNLLKFVIKEIINSKIINKFVLASDSSLYYSRLDNLKNKVVFFQRGKSSSKDNSSSESVIVEYLKKTKDDSDIIILLQVTNPFITKNQLDSAISEFLNCDYDSMLSGVKNKYFFWKNKVNSKSINYNYKKRVRSQNFNENFIENGSFYIFYKKNFLKYKNRLHGKIGIYEMPIESIHELDDMNDLRIIKKLLI